MNNFLWIIFLSLICGLLRDFIPFIGVYKLFTLITAFNITVHYFRSRDTISADDQIRKDCCIDDVNRKTTMQWRKYNSIIYSLKSCSYKDRSWIDYYESLCGFHFNATSEYLLIFLVCFLNIGSISIFLRRDILQGILSLTIIQLLVDAHNFYSHGYKISSHRWFIVSFFVILSLYVLQTIVNSKLVYRYKNLYSGFKQGSLLHSQL